MCIVWCFRQSHRSALRYFFHLSSPAFVCSSQYFPLRVYLSELAQITIHLVDDSWDTDVYDLNEFGVMAGCRVGLVGGVSCCWCRENFYWQFQSLSLPVLDPGAGHNAGVSGRLREHYHEKSPQPTTDKTQVSNLWILRELYSGRGRSFSCNPGPPFNEEYAFVPFTWAHPKTWTMKPEI